MIENQTNNTFLELLDYVEAPELELKNKNDLRDELDFYLQNSNNSCLDLINYERLFFIEAMLQEDRDEEAEKLLNILKREIVSHYITKTKQKYRYLWEDSIYYDNIIDKNATIIMNNPRE